VVLEVHIGRDGAVQDVQFVSGPPELAQASTDAVKQWRFRPLQVNGSTVPMQTRITLNFSLPQ
jgi:TonB family protein